MTKKRISYEVRKLSGYLGSKYVSSGVIEGTDDEDVYENAKSLVGSVIRKDIKEEDMTSKVSYNITFEALL